MSLADVSTARLVLDAQRLDTRMTHAPRNINVLTVEKNMHHTTKSAVIIRGNLIFNISEYQKMYLFLNLVQFIKKTHGQRVMNYPGATKTPTQCTSVCTQTDVSWVGAQPATRKQRSAASVTSRPVPSVSRSVGTTTCVADVKHVVPPKSSPPKKDTKSTKPSCCWLPTPMTLASGGGPMFPLVVHQPASPSIWPAVQSLRRGLSTNPGVTMWCVCGCS